MDFLKVWFSQGTWIPRQSNCVIIDPERFNDSSRQVFVNVKPNLLCLFVLICVNNTARSMKAKNVQN